MEATIIGKSLCEYDDNLFRHKYEVHNEVKQLLRYGGL